MTDSEIAQRLTYVHQTLELIALLLAVLLVQQGGFGTVVGGGAILLLLWNVLSRFGENSDKDSGENSGGR